LDEKLDETFEDGRDSDIGDEGHVGDYAPSTP